MFSAVHLHGRNGPEGFARTGRGSEYWIHLIQIGFRTSVLDFSRTFQGVKFCRCDLFGYEL